LLLAVLLLRLGASCLVPVLPSIFVLFLLLLFLFLLLLTLLVFVLVLFLLSFLFWRPASCQHEYSGSSGLVRGTCSCTKNGLEWLPVIRNQMHQLSVHKSALMLLVGGNTW
jgi:hypothetical protein